MIKKWLTWINYALIGTIGALLLATLYFMAIRPTDFPLLDTAVRKSDIPKGAFARPEKDYQAIGSPALDLTFSPLSVQLPDLRRYLIYYGKNSRPDSKEDKPVLYFAFTGNKTPVPVSPEEQLFVVYDKKQTPPQYVFSQNNAEAPLRFEASAQGNQAVVKVSMKGDNGQIVREPTAYAEFTLPEKEFVRFSGTAWELGKWRVDGTLLARQKARWYGSDRFLEDHGGDEFKDLATKQRIDFGEGEEAYSVYVGQGDCMIWDNNRWQTVNPGKESLNYALMCIKKIDERIMNLELWDVDGKGKMALNLVKSNEAWMPQNLEQGFKFIGARTRSQFIFEINNERLLLSPHDWLLFTDSAWKKLKTAQEIDDYVERRTVGPLFVFDQIDRKDDRQLIIGTIYNSARTEKVTIELALQQGNGQTPGKNGADEKKQKSKEGNPPQGGNNPSRPSPHPLPQAKVNMPDDDEDED